MSGADPGAASRPARFWVFRASVAAREEVAPGLVRLALQAPQLEGARPGQFVSVTCRDEGSLDPLMRRPFSLAGWDRERGLAWIVVKAMGRGSGWLARRRPGDAVDVMGPLGRGFWPPPEPGRPEAPVVLVGGGTGVAPLAFLAAELAGGGRWSVIAALGFRTGAEAALAREFEPAGARVLLATEDGSAGRRGTAVSVAETVWDQAAAVYACGPWGMLQALERMRRRSPRPLQVAVETTMGCGAGVCLSCVVPWRLREGYRVTGWARACVEGPVFDAQELVWERCPGGG